MQFPQGCFGFARFATGSTKAFCHLARRWVNALLTVGTGLKTCLFEPDSREAIGDVVSTQIWQKCNDATFDDRNAPTAFGLWAYGLILPLNRRHTQRRNIAIRLDLLVRGQGAIGLTAIDASPTVFTAVEHVVGEGHSTIAIEIPDAPGTHAVLLRTLSFQGRNRSEEKDYAEFYEIFRKTFRLPRDFCSAIYDNDRYVQHFYSTKEIDIFKAK